jgi:hypothetical protein
METHIRPQPRVQNLGPMEIPGCDERHTVAQLGILRLMINNSPDSSPLEQSERCADRTTWCIVMMSLECQQDPE